MKLASKIMLLFLLAVVAITGLFSYLTIQQDTREFEHDHAQHAADLVESLKPGLLDAYEKGGHEEAAQSVRISAERIRRTSVRYIYDGESSEGGTATEPPEIMASVRQKESVTITIPDENGVERVHTVFPLELDGDSRAGLDVSTTTEPVEEQVRETITMSVLSVAAVTLICVAMLFVAGVRMIGRPLNQLVDKTKRVGCGDFSGPLQLSRNDELGQLAVAVNEMCEQLAEQRERIHTETAARLETEQQLRHADRLKTVGRLAAGIAHEIGTPLNVVSGRAGLIAGGKLNDEEIQKSAVVIKTEADRIAKIIRELLDFARRSSPQRERVDLCVIVDQAVDLLRTFAKKQNVSLEIEPCDTEYETSVDAGQIQQVVTNLVMNAIQSIPAETQGQVRVRLSSETATPPEDVGLQRGEYFRIDVEDNGTGIEAAHLHEIFEPFFTTKDVGEGTGLGLSISYGIIREHDGWIAVSSEAGQGSRFSIYLPQSAQADQTQSPQESRAEL